jgi:predicted PurR-regulated permease PerM
MTTANNFVLRFWLLILAALLAILWLFRPVMLPFLAGLTIAYFLEPAVTFLEKHKVPRMWGALVVLCGFLFVVASIFVLVWPMIDDQIAALINAMPEYTVKVREHYLPWARHWLSRFSPEDVKKISDAATQSTGEAVGLVGQAVKSIVSGGFALIDAFALSILTSVTAFFVLRDWKKLTGTVDRLIPRKPYAVIREQISEIDRTLSGFMRGQAFVCVILGIFYSAGLALNGLQYGATIGIIAGILTIIPFVGTIFGWVMSFILAVAQFEGDWLRIGLVAAVFLVGNFLESYVLTPRLVGKRVGLHPVWILFALIAGIKLMGFTGALIAVPSAAVIGVLVRFGARLYKSSPIYK